MLFSPIRYRKGYKYQLDGDISGMVPILPEKFIDIEFLRLDMTGRLTIRSGYAWDGASGPTFDTLNTMVPSLVHDALCQLERSGYLPPGSRKVADKFFFELLKERHMWFPRARVWYRGVRYGAKYNSQTPKKVFKAV